jgi:hypothetical protein
MEMLILTSLVPFPRVCHNLGARCAMFVLHSVKIKPGKKPKAFGGEMKLIEPWDPSCGDLKPVTFFLRFR